MTPHNQIRTLAVILAVAIATSSAVAQLPTDSSRRTSLMSHPRVTQALEFLNIWLDAQRAYDQIPGVSAAVVHDQTILWSSGFGHADVARKTPATPATIYSICSISKLFTSVAVMQLRDAGKLRLDDPVGRHLPWFNIKRSVAGAPEITVEGLLTHSSGLPRESDYPYWTGPSFTFPTREQIVERIASQETLYPAETYFQYSNLGISLAGEVVAAASGAPYSAYIQRNILDPLGLSSTTPEMPELHRGTRLATGYGALTRDGTRSTLPFFATRGIAPAAGFASTAEDLARFASWQFRVLSGGSANGNTVLKANTLREMQRVHWMDPNFETSWGLGFAVWRSEDKTFVGHGGSCPGYRSQLLLKPDEKVATVFMANALGVDSDEFAQRMYEIVAPALKTAAKDTINLLRKDSPKATQTDTALQTLRKYAGVYESSFGGEIAVLPWEEGLAALFLPTMNPVKELVKLRKVGEHTFRRIRKDDALGEAIIFEMKADGRPSRFIWHSNHYRRMR
ncbi:MAG: serine hydrolase [Anaerolineae bacterium]|nr:serine hydrolase [Gemmatimonadaceae bacterium]